MKHFLSFVGLGILLTTCSRTSPEQKALSDYFLQAKEFSQKAKAFHQATKSNAPIPTLKALLLDLRLEYKDLQPLLEYYAPMVAQSINGPNLPEWEDADQRELPPEGLQVISTLLHESQPNRSEILKQVAILASSTHRLRPVIDGTPIGTVQLWDACRMALFRIETLDITGFDTVEFLSGVQEAHRGLEAIHRLILPYRTSENSSDFDQMKKLLLLSKVQTQNAEFGTFSRIRYLTEVLHPYQRLVHRIRQQLDIQPLLVRDQVIRPSAATLWDKDAFNPDAFLPYTDQTSSPQKIALGKRLFADTRLSGNGTSCTTCHQPQNAFADHNVGSAQHGGGQLRRNTPSLLYAGLQRALFHDSRVAFLHDQAKEVLLSPKEMHSDLKLVLQRIQADPIYSRAFATAYPGKKLSELLILDALAQYVGDLHPFNSKVDRYFRGNYQALTKNEKAGFDLFTGKAKCATCHFLPLTNGMLPPYFRKSESEVLGIPALNGGVDQDQGKKEYTQADLHHSAFKTPVIRNIGKTFPYMHNGVFKTLDQVLEFYNTGGKSTGHAPRENQTLDPTALNLNAKELSDLKAFLNTLED